MKKPPPDGLQLTLSFDPVETLVQIKDGTGISIDNLWWMRCNAFRKVMLKTAIKQGVRRSDAEDVVQDALIVANEKRDQYQDDNLCGWLCTITKNLAINYYRKEQRKPTVYMEDVSLDSRQSHDNLVESFAIIGDINYAMGKLPEVTRNVCDMYLQGKTQKEIRGEVNRAKSAVQRHINKARECLKVNLSDYKMAR
jgi:RNA polymerase sigma factor (sigma-70 family)